MFISPTPVRPPFIGICSYLAWHLKSLSTHQSVFFSSLLNTQRITLVNDYINRKCDGFAFTPPSLSFFPGSSFKCWCCILIKCEFPHVNPIKVNRILVLLLNKFQSGLTFEKYITSHNTQNTTPSIHIGSTNGDTMEQLPITCKENITFSSL